ncbi:MAG: efflux RND transporter periplasmic adaptor subunit [Oceanospirillaceae bacterium]|nr:efflux RND transporter periplasmic adaptor subunit [Oceanospirillaceae bacterium]
MRFPNKLIALGVAIAVQTAVAADEFMLDATAIRAQLTAERQAVLSAEMAGRISQLNLREGQAVEKGDLLAAFDCNLQQAQLKKANAQRAAAQNTLKGNRRMAELNAIGDVELQNSQLEVSKAQADIDYLKAQIDRCEIRAPFSGSIGDRLVNEQEFVQVGTPLFEILDDSSLQIEFIAPSRWISWLTPGLRFEIGVEDTEKLYNAELLYTAAKVDAMSQSIKVFARVTDPSPELKPGMSGQINLVPPQGN